MCWNVHKCVSTRCWKLDKSRPNQNIRQNSFSHRVINKRNNLRNDGPWSASSVQFTAMPICSFIPHITLSYIKVPSHGCHGVSNYWWLDCLCSSLFRLASKRPPELHISRLFCEVKSEFPPQRASNVDNVVMSWSFHNIQFSLVLNLVHWSIVWGINWWARSKWCPRRFHNNISIFISVMIHDDAVKWKHFPRCWPFVRGIHRSPVNSPHKCQWRGALMFSLICVWINGWVNNREASDLRRYRAHCDITVM